MDSLLTLRLEAFSRLSAEERTGLNSICDRPGRTVCARRDLVREGDAPRYIHLIVEGWACRYKQLPDGRRQVVAIFVPGDMCDSNVFILKHMDHSIGAITDIRAVELGARDMEALTTEHPGIMQALWWHELVTAATQREWMLNLGQRTAYERIAHLITELFVRLEAVGLTYENACDFHMTQSDIADATGLTAVHVNRMLQDLRRDGLIQLERSG
mgnify:CR=1 FL=1